MYLIIITKGFFFRPDKSGLVCTKFSDHEDLFHVI